MPSPSGSRSGHVMEQHMAWGNGKTVSLGKRSKLPETLLTDKMRNDINDIIGTKGRVKNVSVDLSKTPCIF